MQHEVIDGRLIRVPGRSGRRRKSRQIDHHPSFENGDAASMARYSLSPRLRL